MAPPLDKDKKKRLQDLRDQKVQEQAKKLFEIVEENKDNPFKLNEFFRENSKKYKSDAMEIVLNKMREGKDLFPSKSRKIVANAWHSRRIGGVKENRALDAHGEKTSGVTPGGTFKKQKRPDKPENLLSQDKIILRKKGAKSGGFEGEEVCEYLGTNLSTPIMGGDLSPKFRIHTYETDGKKEVAVASTFIKDFTVLADNPDKSKAKGFGRVFARQAMIGNYDYHKENTGITTLKDGSKHFTSIDDGRALSYNIEVDWNGGYFEDLGKPQTALEFQEGMKEMYPEEFEGKEFVHELNQAVDSMDEDVFRHIIKESFINIKKAYGENFLENENIKKEFQSRMGIQGELTEDIIENKIIENMNSRRDQLIDIVQISAMKIVEQAVVSDDNKAIEDVKKDLDPKMLKRLESFEDSLRDNKVNEFFHESSRNGDAASLEYKKIKGLKYKEISKIIYANNYKKLNKIDMDNPEYLIPNIKDAIKNKDYKALEILDKNTSKALDIVMNNAIKTKDNEALKFLNHKAPNAAYRSLKAAIIERNTDVVRLITKNIENVHYKGDVAYSLANDYIKNNDIESFEFLKENIAYSTTNSRKTDIDKGVIDSHINRAIISNIEAGSKDFIKELIIKSPETFDSSVKQAIDRGSSRAIKKLNSDHPKYIVKFFKEEKDYQVLVDMVKLNPAMKIEGMSPLKWSVKEKRGDLAIKMAAEGMSLAKGEINTDAKREIFNSTNILNRGKFTENDKLRMAVISNLDKSEQGKMDLSKKPSPLHLAIETGQIDLAVQLIDSGCVLKKSEIIKHKNKEQKLGFIDKAKIHLSGKKGQKKYSRDIRTSLESKQSRNSSSPVSVANNKSKEAVLGR